jgi:hypothetical protein
VPRNGGLSILRLEDLRPAAVKRVTIADPACVRSAAQQALQATRVWDALKPRLVYGENVRHALQFIETGAVDAGIIALSVADTPAVRYVPIDPSLHAPLNQIAAVVKRSARPELALAFLQFVNGPEGRPIMKRYGFRLPGEFWRGRLRSCRSGLARRPRAHARSACLGLGARPPPVPGRPRRGGGSPLVLYRYARYYLLVLIGERAPVGRLLGGLGIELAFTWRAAVLAASVGSIALLVKAAQAGFEAVDRRLEQAARTLGRRVEYLWSVTLRFVLTVLRDRAGVCQALEDFRILSWWRAASGPSPRPCRSPHHIHSGQSDAQNILSGRRLDAALLLGTVASRAAPDPMLRLAVRKRSPASRWTRPGRRATVVALFGDSGGGGDAQCLAGLALPDRGRIVVGGGLLRRRLHRSPIAAPPRVRVQATRSSAPVSGRQRPAGCATHAREARRRTAEMLSGLD